MAKSLWTQTEAAQVIAYGMLKAIIIYSDRSWTHVTVYGSSRVAEFLRQPMGDQPVPEEVTHKEMRDLPSLIGAGQGAIAEGTAYGLPFGKVLLVSDDGFDKA